MQTYEEIKADFPDACEGREELTAQYDVRGFLAPYVDVVRKSDGQRGTLMFQHDPRVYFKFEPY